MTLATLPPRPAGSPAGGRGPGGGGPAVWGGGVARPPGGGRSPPRGGGADRALRGGDSADRGGAARPRRGVGAVAGSWAVVSGCLRHFRRSRLTVLISAAGPRLSSSACQGRAQRAAKRWA